jgi:hypothetical protein
MPKLNCGRTLSPILLSDDVTLAKLSASKMWDTVGEWEYQNLFYITHDSAFPAVTQDVNLPTESHQCLERKIGISTECHRV